MNNDPINQGTERVEGNIDKLKFETIFRRVSEAANTANGLFIYRAKVIGGWLVFQHYARVDTNSTPQNTKEVGGVGIGNGLAFIPDINHQWNLDDYMS